MPQRHTIVCPIDFSEHARRALRYSALVAGHFGARLLVITVNDPLLVQAALMAYDPERLEAQSRRDLREFCAESDLSGTLGADDVIYQVRMGKPAPEILKAAAEHEADLIVLSTHGLSGVRKAFFGATTERVLRETTVPVLIAPKGGDAPASVADAARSVARILVPVDLTSATPHQLEVAHQLAVILGVPLLVTHVIEPLALPMRWGMHVGSVDHERRHRAEDSLRALTRHMTMPVETLLAYGDPAEEIAKVARDRGAGLLVMGLHGSALLAPRMGSVTYRVLCLAPTLMLTIPPALAAREASESSPPSGVNAQSG
jgi:nucleotide-binding universal stress UspA family protein